MNPKKIPLKDLREPVISGQTRTKEWRELQLKKLGELLDQHENEVLNALATDLGKPPTEALFELIAVRQELKLAQKQLNHWMRQRQIEVPLSLKPGKAFIKPEPIGCILIIGPWNYPFSLIFQPIVSALAAGNTSVIKPSEQAPATSALIAKIIPLHFKENVLRVVEGDGNVAADLLENAFDHIFFTGGGSIGKKVMAAAAAHLTPVTLELGGKSPAIVLEGADLLVTARRLMWGKGLNSGQTCIAPDHVIVQEQLKVPLLEAMKNVRSSFYGSNPLTSQDLAKIINEYHFKRILELLENAKRKGQILLGGEVNLEENRIAPTIIEVNDRNDPLMQEELFGPLFPILTSKNLKTAISDIQKQPNPLAIYMFGGTSKDQELLINSTSSGGVCFNDVVMQAGVPELPFGGVGASGMGRYHGIAGFETFSHQKAVLKRPFWLDLKFRYPPYKLDLSILKGLLK